MIKFNKLSEHLWAIKGYRIKSTMIYPKVGNLRNNIQHFLYPKNIDFTQEAVEFIYEIIDPAINEF